MQTSNDFSISSSSLPSLSWFYVFFPAPLCLASIFVPMLLVIFFIMIFEEKGIWKQYRIKRGNPRVSEEMGQRWRNGKDIERKQVKCFLFLFFFFSLFFQTGGRHYYMLVSDMNSDEENPIIKDILNQYLLCAKQCTKKQSNSKAFVPWTQEITQYFNK